MRLFPALKLSWIKKFLPRGLFARSLLILVTPIFLIQIILAYVFFDNHWNRVTDRLVYAVTGEIAIIVDLIENPPTGLPIYQVENLNKIYLELNSDFDPHGKLTTEQETFRGWGIVVGSALVNEISENINHPHRVSINMPGKEVTVQIAVNGGVLNVDVPLRRLFSSTAYIFLLWMGGVSFVLLMVAVLFMRNQIRPIKRLAVAADWFGKGRDVSFFKVSGSKEVRLAAQSFLKMKDRIQKQVQQRTSMLAGVSHDLRTPLTRMKLQLEMMGDCPDAAAMKHDIHDMERMIDAYLQFARGEGDEETQDTDLLLLMSRCAEAASDDVFKVSVSAEKEEMVVPLRAFAFERCITNLVMNAKRYADEAVITLIEKNEEIEVILDDNGPGITEELREEVFKPFYRGDKSRETKSGSVGLGLNIAQDIVLSHGGDIHLNESPQGGLRVVINLPV